MHGMDYGIEAVFDSLDGQRIEQMVAERRQEDLQLDFKKLSTQDGTFGSDDKKNFAKALSGFANSAGGILVWGVGTAKDKARSVECADAIVGVSDGEHLISKLNEHTGTLALPMVPGVRHKLLKTANALVVVASIIPESDSGPHMAREGLDRYYMRSGHSFRPMEHFQVADMFGRRARPHLELAAEPHLFNTSETKVAVRIGVRNIGRGIAKFPLLSLNVTPHDPFYLTRSIWLKPFDRLDKNSPVIYAGGANDVIHSNTVRWITDTLPVDMKQSPHAEYLISYELAAEGFPAFKSSLRISNDQLRLLVRVNIDKP